MEGGNPTFYTQTKAFMRSARQVASAVIRDVMAAPRQVTVRSENEMLFALQQHVLAGRYEESLFIINHEQGYRLNRIYNPETGYVEMSSDKLESLKRSPTLLDESAILGLAFSTWIVLLLFFVLQIKDMVYMKQKNMFGLGDRNNWMITYLCILVPSTLAMFGFVALCCLFLGPSLVTPHDYMLQFVFYFIYVNFQISFAILYAGFFSKARTAIGLAFLLSIGAGLVGADVSSSTRGWMVAMMESFPGVALYRILYEFSTNGKRARDSHISGMRWEDLNENGMEQLLTNMVVEWCSFLLLSYALDQVSPTLRGRKLATYFFHKPTESTLRVVENEDVARERRNVRTLILERNENYPIMCHDVKVLIGDPPTLAVKGLSFAVRRGQCFAIVGGSGSGKTSLKMMLIRTADLSAGTAYVEGMNIESNCYETSMDSRIGVCPQINAVFEDMTGRNNLLLFGDHKNLQGSALERAVEEALELVNLSDGGVADTLAGEYDNCTKRKLTLAICLLRNPNVLFIDDPTAGLDSDSNAEIWRIMERVKTNKTVLLSTNSIEEANQLSDRVGILVDGRLRRVSTMRELKARYGGYKLTMRTPPEHVGQIEAFVRRLAPTAKKADDSAGVQRFELPKDEVEIDELSDLTRVLEGKFGAGACEYREITLDDIYSNAASSRL